MTKQAKVLTEAQIVSNIASIARRSGTIQEDIHKTAMSILAHWQKAGARGAARAAELLTMLQGASPYHADAFSKWVGNFTDLQWAKETSTWYAPADGVRLMGTKLIEARELPFYKFKPASKPKPFEFYDALESLINKATADRKKKGDESSVSLSVLHQLRELARTEQTA